MAQYTRTFSTTCPGALLEAINNDPGITHTCTQIINFQTGDIVFEFSHPFEEGEEATFDALLDNWSCPVEPEGTPADEFSVDDENTGTDTLWSSQKITDFVQGGSLPVVAYASNENESESTSTSWQEKVDLDVSIPESAFYMLWWSAEVQCERYTRPMGFRIQVNNTTDVQDLEFAPTVFNSYEKYSPISGFQRIYLNPGSISIDMDYKSLIQWETVKIRKARLALMKVSD